MNRQARQKILGKRFIEFTDEWATRCTEWFVGVGHYPQEGIMYSYRRFDVDTCLDAMVVHHFGYKLPVKPEEFLNQGFDVVVDYFCNDWWKQDKNSAKALDKSRRPRSLVWFTTFSEGLLLGLLSERWDELARVCDWVEADLRPEYLGDEIEMELVHVYRSLAAGLRPEPMPGLARVEDKIRKCRTLRPKLLFQAWEAAREGNQAAFEGAFLKSLEHFMKSYGSGLLAREWIAEHQSVMAMAAQRLGMKLPKLPPELEPVVMTRQSLEFSKKRK
jgi:hypothetical protein